MSTATVKNGDVVFESGATYKVLVFTGKLKLNPNYEYISYESIKKLAELIKAGAKVIIADKPLYQNGIKQVSDSDFNQVIEEIWGGNFDSFKSGGKPVYVKKLGLGQIYRAPFEGNDFNSLGLEKDLDIHEKGPLLSSIIPLPKHISYIHRKSDNEDVYFISNQEDKQRDLILSFRLMGRIPKLYNAVTNDTIALNSWSIKDGRTNIALKLEPNQSLFVIFDKNTTETQFTKGNNWSKFKTAQDISKDWQVQFDATYGGPLKLVSFSDLIDWTKHSDSSIKYYSGTAIYKKTFNYKGDLQNAWIDLGGFSSMAEVKVNGISCGTLWTAPHRLDISKAIKKGKNEIIIEVVNTWANRLIGDGKLPENKRLTKTTAPFRLEGKPLNPAGLFGPVIIQLEEK
ncbi:MAG: hypothetical protein EOP55_10975 [Sphingobacteriales bacterium]|nr:MAG: hypothetical protein EOP55_10975 [Sphingobacteriales bacterium]